MPAYETIKQATETVEKYKKEFASITTSIEKLNERKEELQKKLDGSTERFTLESIEKNATLKRDLNLVNQYLKEAQEQYKALKDKTKGEAYKDAVNVLKAHKEASRHKHKAKNKTIIEHLYAIRKLNEEIKADEAEEYKKINTFLADIAPYLEDDDIFRRTSGGRTATQKIKADTIPTALFHVVPEKAYGVTGLLKFNESVRNSLSNAPKVSKLNELYGVEKKE